MATPRKSGSSVSHQKLFHQQVSNKLEKHFYIELICNVWFLNYSERENKRLRSEYNNKDKGGKTMKDEYENRIE